MYIESIIIKSQTLMKWSVSSSSLVGMLVKFTFPLTWSTEINSLWTPSLIAYSRFWICQSPLIVVAFDQQVQLSLNISVSGCIVLLIRCKLSIIWNKWMRFLADSSFVFISALANLWAVMDHHFETQCTAPHSQIRQFGIDLDLNSLSS